MKIVFIGSGNLATQLGLALSEAVATVDQTGKVTAIGEWTATITATATGYDAAGIQVGGAGPPVYVASQTCGDYNRWSI